MNLWLPHFSPQKSWHPSNLNCCPTEWTLSISGTMASGPLVNPCSWSVTLEGAGYCNRPGVQEKTFIFQGFLILCWSAQKLKTAVKNCSTRLHPNNALINCVIDLRQTLIKRLAFISLWVGGRSFHNLRGLSSPLLRGCKKETTGNDT